MREYVSLQLCDVRVRGTSLWNESLCLGYSFENANVAHPKGLATPLSSFLITSKSCTYRHGEYLVK
jgi:hypothetical protein